jgi:hypothetical protein
VRRYPVFQAPREEEETRQSSGSGYSIWVRLASIGGETRVVPRQEVNIMMITVHEDHSGEDYNSGEILDL